MGQGAVIGLDIGNTSIKMAEVHAAKGGAQIKALGIAPTPLDSIAQNTIVDPGAIAAAIKELMASCGAHAHKVVSSVSGQQSLVIRIIEVPRMTEKELAETMKWEVERHVPFASSELQMDYQIINQPDAPPESQTMEVLLVVAQQDMISTHLETVEGAGLEPIAIDVEPLAASRALVDIYGAAQPGRTTAMVNIGAQSTDISIVRDGNLLFQRTIATAGDSLTQAIAATLNVSAEEAEHIKKIHGSVDLDGFDQQVSAADVFGGGEETPFGFGPPVFEGAAEAPAAAEEPTLFNPFATEAETPQAEDIPLAAPAAPADETPAAPQWSPFGLSEEEEPAAASANPFAIPESTDNAAAPENAEASPFGGGFAEGGNEGSEGGFDLSAFGADGFASAESPDNGSSASEQLTPQQVFAIIREPLTDLVTEIKRSVDYFRGRSSDASIDEVILSGGTARLPNLDQLLAGELTLPVAIADPFKVVPVQSSQYSPEYLRQIAPLFAVSVGLGLRETVF